MKILSKLALAAVAVVVLALAPIGVAWAQVKVTSADPASTTQGTVSLDVTINGSGFDNGSTARFLVTGTTIRRRNLRAESCVQELQATCRNDRRR